MSTASDAQHQDFGVIEAAVKETARGRAFLASFARRVQHSDTLTMLAMLGRLERLSNELASRLAELETREPFPTSQLAASGADTLPHESASKPPQHETADTMQRIDDLALVLDNLHHRAVQLASRCESTGSTPAVELDPCAFAPPGQAAPAGHQDLAEEEVLDKITRALAPTS
jgi:hypothetical protein